MTLTMMPKVNAPAQGDGHDDHRQDDSQGGDSPTGGSVGGDEAQAGGERVVGYEHSRDLPQLLASINATLLVSTYQAGKLAVIGSHDGQLARSFHNFDRPMGVAIDRHANRMAVAARNKVWMLSNNRDIATQLEPRGGCDACFLTHSAQVTGEIQAHEMGFAGSELWLVNTLFSCLCTLDAQHSFVPRWQPRFIGRLAPEDRCHLNGLAMYGGRPKYVTAMGETDAAGAWRANKAQGGVLIDVDSGETIARGFAMPHSPRVHMGQVWLCDSGRGALVRVDPKDGSVSTVARFPGYTRGLAMIGTLAFVGLSRIRETSTFGGVPIAENRERLKCGVGVVDVQTGELVGQFEFKSGVEEIFDVSLLTASRFAAVRGPFSADDGEAPVWVVPQSGGR
ncbi:MAG: TIGR03032 family protein [Pirellulales bacterium]